MNKSFTTNFIAILIIIAGYLSPLYSLEIKTMGLYSFSGAVTNWLAIHMLFEKIPGLYGSGIITERFGEFKAGIRHMMMNQFFTEENLKNFMTENSSMLSLNGDSIVETIDFDKIFNKLKQAILESQFGPMLSMFGGEQALDPLKESFQNKMKEEILLMVNDKEFINKLTHEGASSFSLGDSVENIIDERLNELTPLMVKDIIQEMIREHLGWLVVWGGIFGALIGLASTLLT